MHSTHAVQTFSIDPSSLPAGGAIDHVRLMVASNWGHPGFTCLYRLRVHGVQQETKAGSGSVSARLRACS